MSHGLCGRALGIHLSTHGKSQAEALACGLEEEPLAALYCSPLERAQETAKAIATRHRLEPIPEERITELDFGHWTGKTFDELSLEPLWSEYNRARSTVTPPGGESPMSALQRCRTALHDISQRHASATIAMVTHADVIRSLLTSLLNMALDDLLRFEIAPASVSEVSYGGGHPVIGCINMQYVQRR